MVNLRSPATGWGHVADVMTHLTLPCATMTLIQIPQYLRITRSSVVQAMQEDYMTTFRAAGMSEGRIFRRYVLKNTILPTLTVFGISLAYVVSGAALVEIVYLAVCWQPALLYAGTGVTQFGGESTLAERYQALSAAAEPMAAVRWIALGLALAVCVYHAFRARQRKPEN